MSIQSKIDCPDCGHPIYFESSLMLAGRSFQCSNPQCHVSIALAASEQETVKKAFHQYEALQQNAVKEYETFQES